MQHVQPITPAEIDLSCRKAIPIVPDTVITQLNILIAKNYCKPTRRSIFETKELEELLIKCGYSLSDINKWLSFETVDAIYNSAGWAICKVTQNDTDVTFNFRKKE